MINFVDKKITVMGLGLHGGGLAVAKWLLSVGAKVTITDLKTKAELKESILDLESEADRLKRTDYLTFHLGVHQEEDFAEADMIIKNPAVPRTSKWLDIAKKNNVVIHNEASLFFLLAESPIIAITGSKGKSTTTALIGEIFQLAFSGTLVAGNIRTTPMFAIIDKVRGVNKAPFVVLELSSWQLEMLANVKKSPQTAVITNIFPEHLNTYDSIEDYFQAKLEIARYQNKDDNLVLNFLDQRLQEFGLKAKQRVFWFGLNKNIEPGVLLTENSFIWKKGGRKENIFSISDFSLPGRHNLDNAAAAICVAKIYKIENKFIKQALLGFSGLPGRIELVGNVAARFFYNDTTATAPIATIASLNTFKQKVILIAGGNDKNLPLSELADKILEKVKKVILLPGSGTERLIAEFEKRGFSDYILSDSMPAAVQSAYQFSEPKDVILLSPAFASFGLFLHEFDRGYKFKEAIKLL